MQHEVKTMTAALIGLKLDMPSDKILCMFPHNLVTCIEKVETYSDSISEDKASAIEDSMFRNNEEHIEDKLDDVLKILEDENLEKAGSKHLHRATLFKVNDDNYILMIQV